MTFARKLVMFCATGGYIGNIPWAPGTFGSLPGLGLAVLLAQLAAPAALMTLALFIVCAAAVAHRAEKLLDRKDAGCIVVDEMAGMAVTLMGVPLDATSVAAGFLIFRLLDIAKPFPVRFLETAVPGGAGVVMDDVAAGILGNVLLRVTILVIG